jgi:hypothetical protein
MRRVKLRGAIWAGGWRKFFIKKIFYRGAISFREKRGELKAAAGLKSRYEPVWAAARDEAFYGNKGADLG